MCTYFYFLSQKAVNIALDAVFRLIVLYFLYNLQSNQSNKKPSLINLFNAKFTNILLVKLKAVCT